MDTYFTIIDAEKRIGACDIYDIPGELKKRISNGLVGNTLAELTFSMMMKEILLFLIKSMNYLSHITYLLWIYLNLQINS